jgi:RNA-directed DNA polymerase
MRRRGESLDRADWAARNRRWGRKLPDGLGSPTGPSGYNVKVTLLQKVRKIGTLGHAWRVIHENGRSSQSRETRREIEEFAVDAESRLTRIQHQLCRGTFKFPPAKGVEAPKPGKTGIRPIVVAPVESRIVQRAVHDVLLRVPSIRRCAENPYSFGGVRKLEGKTLAAVPAAIQAVLAAISNGAVHVVRSDIVSFFTKISKPAVTAIVVGATGEPEFVELFSCAIALELENLARLRERAAAFPIHEIGVAQGNSLSPLLGNLLLYDFDQEMNSGDCYCFRYIDDFIILAPDQSAAERQFSYAKRLLKNYGMEVSPDSEKTQRSDIRRGFVFLGIHLVNGVISPSRESRRRLLDKVSALFGEGAHAIHLHRKTGRIDRKQSFIRTLYDVSGIVSGWGHHYSFCNDKNVLSQLDASINELLRKYVGTYVDAIRCADPKGRRRLIGIPLLEELASHPFIWPKVASTIGPPALPLTPAASPSL